jgi:hypothetical protein
LAREKRKNRDHEEYTYILTKDQNDGSNFINKEEKRRGNQKKMLENNEIILLIEEYLKK